MIKKILILVFSLLFLFSCGEEQKEEAETVPVPSPIVKEGTNIALSPENPTKDSKLSLALNNLQASQIKVDWLVNNNLVPVDSKVSFSYPYLQKGDIVQAKVIVDDQDYYSNKVTIQNSPPVIVGAEFVPEKPKKDDIIALEIKSNDPDGDFIQYVYKWFVNGTYVSNEVTLEGQFKRDDEITVQIVASDDEDDSDITYKFKNTIHNSLPVVSNKLVDESFEDGLYKVKVKAHDPDGDTLTFLIKENIKDLSINPEGQIIWKTGDNYTGEQTFTVLISDGHGGDMALPVTVNIVTKEMQKT